MGDAGEPFRIWSHRWMELATFRGRLLPDAERRIEAVLSLWREPIPPGWQRDDDARVLDRYHRYTRGNAGEEGRRSGEHAIEWDILHPDPSRTPTRCLGMPLLDGVNAVPLTRDAGGRRGGNVEADMLLLTGEGNTFRLLLTEVKDESDHAWYGVVENLRQLRLFQGSVAARRIMRRRRGDLPLPEHPPVTGIVLAPPAFYKAPGRRSAAVAPARTLALRAREEVDADVRLTTWDADRRTIEPLDEAPAPLSPVRPRA